MKRRPPEIKIILQAILNRVRAEGEFRSRRELREFIQDISREYTEKGVADDLVRYLLNRGVFTEDEDSLTCRRKRLKNDLWFWQREERRQAA